MGKPQARRVAVSMRQQERTGRRDAAGPMVVGDHLEPGCGGICQVTTTLFDVAFAGLDFQTATAFRDRAAIWMPPLHTRPGQTAPTALA